MDTLIVFPFDTALASSVALLQSNHLRLDFVLFATLAFYIWFFAYDGWFTLTAFFFHYGWTAIISALASGVIWLIILITIKPKQQTEES